MSPTKSPTKPNALGASGRATSVIHPSSANLQAAHVTGLPGGGKRALSEHDVLCGRGGLVNGYVGNIAFRDVVSAKRDLYLKAKKRDKADVAKAIVREVKARGGLFLRREDDVSGKGGKGAKSKATDSSDGRGSRWVDIGEDKSREKTSQALREGLDVRGKSGGAREDGPKKKRPKKSPSSPYTPPSDGRIHLASFLPQNVATYVEMKSTAHVAIKTPDKFEEVTSTEEGRQELAQRLFEWSGSVSAHAYNDRAYDWLNCLGTVELWRRQVDIWADGLAHLKAKKEAETVSTAENTTSV